MMVSEPRCSSRCAVRDGLAFVGTLLTCAACSTTCPAGSGLATACNATNDRTCSPCVVGERNVQPAVRLLESSWSVMNQALTSILEAS